MGLLCVCVCVCTRVCARARTMCVHVSESEGRRPAGNPGSQPSIQRRPLCRPAVSSHDDTHRVAGEAGCPPSCRLEARELPSTPSLPPPCLGMAWSWPPALWQSPCLPLGARWVLVLETTDLSAPRGCGLPAQLPSLTLIFGA